MRDHPVPPPVDGKVTEGRGGELDRRSEEEEWAAQLEVSPLRHRAHLPSGPEPRCMAS